MKLLIAIISASHHTSRREICRQSWMKSLESLTVEAFFFVGQAPRCAGVVSLPVPDDYRSLIQKVHGVMRYCLDLEFDYLFKCDDDTFVAVERLFDRSNSAKSRSDDYVGQMHGGPLFALGGAGYLLSRRAVEVLARSEAPLIGMEDAWVGRALAAGGIKAVQDVRFVQRSTPSPDPSNDIITCHMIRSHVGARMIQEQLCPRLLDPDADFQARCFEDDYPFSSREWARGRG